MTQLHHQHNIKHIILKTFVIDITYISPRSKKIKACFNVLNMDLNGRPKKLNQQKTPKK